MHFPWDGLKRGGRQLTVLTARWRIVAARLTKSSVVLFATPALGADRHRARPTATAQGETQIDLSQTAPTANSGAVISGYRIEVSSSGQPFYSDLVADTRSTDTAYSHTGLSASATRHYRVSALNSVGAGSPSNAAGATTAAADLLVSNTGQNAPIDDYEAIGDQDATHSQGSDERQQVVAAAELLGQLLLQDVERKSADGDANDGVSVRDGVSKDRILSVHDPGMRHGSQEQQPALRRAQGGDCSGHTGSQLITAVEVLPGNAPDNLGALELVERRETNTGVPVDEAMGDVAHRTEATRQAFADAGRALIARVPGRPNRKHFPKEDFHIDLEAGACTCPVGNVARRIVPFGARTGPTGRTHRLKGFRFDGAVCGVCPRSPQCVAGYRPRRRCWSTGWRGWRSARPATSGRAKTRFQLYLAATRANLTLVAAKPDLPAGTGGDTSVSSVPHTCTIRSAFDFVPARLGQIFTLALLASVAPPKYISPNNAFLPDFWAQLPRV